MNTVPAALNSPEANFIVGLTKTIAVKMCVKTTDEPVMVELELESIKKASLNKYALVFELKGEKNTPKFRYLFYDADGGFNYSFGNRSDMLERSLKLFTSASEAESEIAPVMKSQTQIRDEIKRAFLCELTFNEDFENPFLLLSEREEINFTFIN